MLNSSMSQFSLPLAIEIELQARPETDLVGKEEKNLFQVISLLCHIP